MSKPKTKSKVDLDVILEPLAGKPVCHCGCGRLADGKTFDEALLPVSWACWIHQLHAKAVERAAEKERRKAETAGGEWAD